MTNTLSVTVTLTVMKLLIKSLRTWELSLYGSVGVLNHGLVLNFRCHAFCDVSRKFAVFVFCGRSRTL